MWLEQPLSKVGGRPGPLALGYVSQALSLQLWGWPEWVGRAGRSPRARLSGDSLRGCPSGTGPECGPAAIPAFLRL